MRYIILFSLLCTSAITSARDLFVLLYITDAEVVDMYCETDEMNLLRAPVAHGSFVLSKGRVSWHAVGGVPPYTDLLTEQGPGGVVKVTVMDAACNIFTACGVIGVNRISKMVNCAMDAAGGPTATPLFKAIDERTGTCDKNEHVRSATPGTRTVTRATNSRSRTPGATTQRTAIRAEGPLRPAPRPTPPAPKSVTPANTGTR